MDISTSHLHPKVLEFLYENVITYVTIPPGFTRYLQPLDIYINKEFKLNLKEKYTTYQAQQSSFIKNEEFSVTKETIVHWVLEIWKNEKFIIKR